MNSWNDKIEVKKGNVGEAIVDDFLIKKGLIPYKPIMDISHPFDRLIVSRNGNVLFIADIKSKPARKYYSDTGINFNTYQEYKSFQDKYSIEIILFFVDEDNRTVYGNKLSELIKRRSEFNEIKNAMIDYPLIQSDIIYFPLSAMKQIGKIPNEEVEKLENFSTRNEKYCFRRFDGEIQND